VTNTLTTSDSGAESGGAVPHFSGNDLLEMMPKVSNLANVSVYDFGKFPGPHMTPELMLKLSKKIQEFLAKENLDGIIVTHGTDTLEETAYLLDLTIKTENPIVVIGSMKNSSEPDWDGPKNLKDAIFRKLIVNNCHNFNGKWKD